MDGRSRASGAAHESDAEFGEIGANFRRPESGSDGVTTECVGVLVDGLKGGRQRILSVHKVTGSRNMQKA